MNKFKENHLKNKLVLITKNRDIRTKLKEYIKHLY